MAVMISTGSIDSLADTFAKQKYIIDWRSPSAQIIQSNNLSLFNSPVIVGEECVDMSHWFLNLYSFNQEVIIPNSVTNCYGMLKGCSAYNRPMNVPDNTNASDMLENIFNFNSNVIVGNNVDASYMLSNCYNFNANVVFGDNVNACKCFYSVRGIGKRVVIPGGNSNVYMMFFNASIADQNILQIKPGTTSIDGLFAYSRYGARFDIPQGIVNAKDLFNNANSFNNAVTIPNSVKDCSGMFCNAGIFNYSVTIPDGVENCANMFEGATNYNRPTTIPASVKNCDFMFARAGTFNADVTIQNGVTSITNLFFTTPFNRPLTIPTSVTNISGLFSHASYYNQALLQPVPSHIKDISHLYDGTYAMCQKIQNSGFTIPATVTNFYGVFANAGMYLMNKITMPSSATSWHGLFAGCMTTAQSQQTISIPAKVTDCSCLFERAGYNFGNVNINLHEGIVNCSRMFNGMAQFSSVELGGRILVNGATSQCIPKSAKDCSYMFANTSLTVFQSARQYNVGYSSRNSNIENCQGMYMNCRNFTGGGTINFGEKVTDCSHMFENCLNANFQINFNDAVNLKNCAEMFSRCSKYSTPSYKTVIPNSVNNCHGMFNQCGQDLGRFTLNVGFSNGRFNNLDCSEMFTVMQKLSTFANGTLKFPMGTVNCKGAFYYCTNLSSVNIYIPNTVKDCDEMFQTVYNMYGNIYIYPNNIRLDNATFLPKSYTAQRLNIYCSNMNMIVGANVNISKIFGNGTITHESLTPTTNGYYISGINVCILNNIPAWTD